MDNPWNLSEEQVNRLLQMAGKKLGVDPQTLRSQLEQGSLESLGPDSQRIQELLSNPDRLRGAMGNGEPKSFLGALFGSRDR